LPLLEERTRALSRAPMCERIEGRAVGGRPRPVEGTAVFTRVRTHVNNTHIASAHAWDVEADGLFLFRRGSELDPAEGADRDDQRVGRLVPRIRHVERHHPEAGLGLDVLEDEARVVGELDLDDRLLDPVGLGERGDRLVEPVDERLVRHLGDRCPEVGHASTLARRAESDLDEPVDDVGERQRRIDLVRAGGAEQWLDLARWPRISSRSSGDFPYSFVVRAEIRARTTSAGALRSTIARSGRRNAPWFETVPE